MVHKVDYPTMLNMRFKIVATLVMLVTLAVGESWATSSVVKNGSTTTITWDFSEYTENTQVTNEPYNSADAQLAALIVNTGTASSAGSYSEYVSKNGFRPNGASTSTTCFLKYNPSYNGTVTVTYISNNSTANDRIVAIGKSIVTGNNVATLKENANVLDAGLTEGYTPKTISANLTAGTDYYFYLAYSGCTIQKVVYVYNEASGSDSVSESLESLTINGQAISSSNISTLNASKTITINDVYTSVPSIAVSTTDHQSPVVGAPAVSGKQYTYTFSYNEEDYTVVLPNVNIPNNTATLLYTIAKDTGGTLDTENRTWTSADGKLVVDYSKKSNNFDPGAQLNGYKFYNTQLDFTAPEGYAIDYIQITGYTNYAGSEIPLTVTGSGIISPTYSKYKGTSTVSNIDVINYIDETPTAREQYSVYFGTPQSNGSKVLIYGHKAEAPIAWHDIAMDLRANTLTASNAENYIEVDNEGNVTTTTTNPGNNNPVIKVNRFNGTQHGYINMDLTVPVPAGIYRISLGNCQFNNANYTITTEDGSVNKSVDAKKSCDNTTAKDNHTDVYLKIENQTTLYVKMPNGYTPYFSITKQNEEPTDVSVFYSMGSTGAQGTLPASTSFAKSGTYTLPAKNYTLYKEGYTLTGWSDGAKPYALGAEYTHTKSDYDVTFTPVFTKNTANLADRTTTVTAKWNFGPASGAPTLAYQNVADLIYITQATVEGQTIDVKLDYSTNPGKVNNENRNDKWCQMNTGTKFILPSCAGATFTIEAANVTTGLTVNDVPATGNTDKIYSTTISAADNTATVVLAADGKYYSYLQMELPAVRVATPVITENEGNVTIACATDGASIYYTTDGSEPNNTCTLYNSTFTLENNATVKAIAVKDGLTNSKVASLDVTVAEPTIKWKDIKMDFTGEGSFIRTVTTTQWGAINKGIAVAEDGTVSAVAADADNSRATLTGSYHSTNNGVSSAKLVVPVSGPVKISIGQNGNGTLTWNVTDGSGSEVVTFLNVGKTYTTGSKDIAVAYYNGPATTLTINGSGTYTGYIAVEEIASESVPYLVTFSKSDNDVNGILPTSTYVSRGGKFTAPVNYTLYKEGYTLTAWEDAAGNKYTPGQQITVNSNLHLSAIFTENTVSLADRSKEVTLKWDAQTRNGCPVYTFGGNSQTLYFVTQATIDGETIDVAEVVTTASSNGCFRNGNWTDWCQVNGPATFVIPSCKGATVSFECYSTHADSRLNGEDVFAHDTRTPSATVTANGATATFTYGADASYFRYLQVILPPARVAAPVINVAGNNVTITCATDGAAIYYTTDGTEPTSSSTLYAGPFTLSDAATVKAIAIKDGLTSSKVTSKVYEPQMEWRDIKLNLMNSAFLSEDEKGKDVTFGIAVDEDRTVRRVTVGANDSRATIAGTDHKDAHGYQKFSMTVRVPGTVRVTVGACGWGGNGTINIGDETIATFSNKIAANTNCYHQNTTTNVVSEICELEEPATLVISGFGYVPYISIEAIKPVDPVDPSDHGYVVVSTTEELLSALEAASHTATSEATRVKIFLKKGTYDLGTTTLTNVTSYISLIGEDREGTVIWNKPEAEGIGITATLRPTGDHIYMQDLSLKCTVGFDAQAEAGRGVALEDNGNYNIYKNVGLLSDQDTYWSRGGVNQKSYFENCYITGTVDYICGGGDIWFEGTTLYNNGRSNADVIVAPATDANTQWGYVFNNCIVDGDANQAGIYNLGRDWQGSPASTFMNTTFKILPNGDAYTKMSDVELVLRFHEYNNRDASGNLVTGHNLNKLLGGSDYNSQLYLTEQQAAEYTLANVFGSWNPAALTAQAEAAGITINGRDLTFPEGTYLVEKEDGTFIEIIKGTSYTLPEKGFYTLRRANEMGGFGPKSEVFPEKLSYPVTATWDFTKSPYPAEGIDGKDADLAANDGTPLVAQVKAKEWPKKLSDNGGTAQFNKGTEIWIPVGSTKDIITVTSYTDAVRLIEYVSVAGTPMSVQPTVYKATEADVEKGYVVVKAEEGTYLKSIKAVLQDPEGNDKPVQQGNWMRYHLNDYEDATESDWKAGNATLSITEEGVNKYNKIEVGSASGNRWAWYDLQEEVADHTDADAVKIEWDAKLQQGIRNNSSQSLFAIHSANSSTPTTEHDFVDVTKTYMYLGCDKMAIEGAAADLTNAQRSKTWYLLDAYSGNKIPLTTGFTDFTLDNTKWYHFKFTYNGKDAKVIITDGTAVVAEANYALSDADLSIANLKGLITTVGRRYGEADVDNITFAVYNQLPAFIVDLPTEAVEAKEDFPTKLKAEAEGAVSYQWYKATSASTDGGELMEGETGMTLVVTPTAAGTEYYYVVATNSKGSTTSQVATVNVTKAIPEITKLEFGDFDFEKKAFKVMAEGVGEIHISYDGGAEVVFDPENLSNSYALNTVTAYATTKEGNSMPVTVTQPITYDPNKPFAAWYYQDDYRNSATKGEMEHEAQDHPITREIGKWYNLINVHLPNSQTEYDVKYPTLPKADLIICTEMEVGGQPIAQKLEPLVGQVPFLNYKSFNYGIVSNRWGWGEPETYSDGTNVNVKLVNPWLKIYDGAKITDTAAEPSATAFGAPGVDMYDKNNSAWNDEIMHLQYVSGLIAPATSFTTFATIESEKIFMHGSIGTVATAYSETAGKVIPARYTDGTAPYMLLSINFDNAQAVSEEAITISGNVAEMMLKGISFDTASEGLAPVVTDNGDGSAHIISDIYKGIIYYKVVDANEAAPTFDAETWQQVDADGNTAKQGSGDLKVYAVVKYPTELTDKPAGVAIPEGTSQMGSGDLVGTDIRIIHFRAGTVDDEENESYTVPSEFSILSKGDEASIGSDYKIPMNVSIVKAEPGKENEPVRPYYRFAGWTADQDVTAMTRNDRPVGFDPLNPTYPIPYPAEQKTAGTLLGTTTFVQMPTNDLMFTSAFYKNKVSLNHASEHTLVTWDFTTDGVLYDRGGTLGSYTEGTYTQDHLGPDVWPAQPINVDNTALYYNRLAHVRDLRYPDEMNELEFSYRYIDVPLFLDARNVTGANNQVFNVSFNNTESAASVKTKDGMIFGIPAVYGMQIKLLGTGGTTFGGANSKTTVGGELLNAADHKLLQSVTGAGTETVTMTYLGKKDYLYVELYEGNTNGDILMKGISVIYPARVNITPQVKVGEAINNEAGKIYYTPVDEEVQLTKATPFTAGIVDNLTAKAAYGYKFVGWYDNEGNVIESGIISTEEDGDHNVIASTLGYTPTATGIITAKFEAIGKVKMQVTTYRNTPADVKTPNLELNGRTANDKGEFATFEFSASQLGETIVLEPTYNETAKCYEIEVTPGTEVTVHGVQIPGNRFSKWSKWTNTAGSWTEDAESIVTENPHTFTVADNVTYYVKYDDVSGGYIVRYENGGETVTVPLQQNSMYEFAAPKYHTAYKEGYSLLGWQNTSKYFIYEGEAIDNSTVIAGQAEEVTLTGKAAVTMDDDLSLTPMYAKNTTLAKLAGRKEAVTVTWDFTQAQRAQVLNFPSNSQGTYVARATVLANDNKYYSCDVPMTYATGRRGRINNTSSAEWCTIGQGTTLTVPTCKGATVTFVTRSAISAADGGTRINGAVPQLKSEGADGRVYTYTVEDDLESVDVVLGKDYSYYKYISVNLPPVRQEHEVALIASDLTDLSTKYAYNSSTKTFIASGTGETETITLKAVNGDININPTATLPTNTTYLGGEKGYIRCPNSAQGFSISGMKDITRICFRQGTTIFLGNAWKVVANAGGKNAKGEDAQEVVLSEGHKSTVPEWIEINDIYLTGYPTITFYNLSYQEKNVDKTTSSGPFDIYLFNLKMYGIAETTDAQMTLEVGGKYESSGELTDGGGSVWVDPYTMCLPTDEEQAKFHESDVRPVEGLEHYATPRRTMQFDEGTEVVMTAEPDFGYEFVGWIDEQGNVISTESPYIFNIHDNKKIYAKYNAIGHIVYTFGGVNYEGNVPGEQQAVGGQFTVPTNRTLYKDDNSTLTYWINPDDPTVEKKALGITQQHYEVTKTYAYGANNDHFTGYDVYLSPGFIDNSFTLLDVEEPVTVRWPFGQKSGAPEFSVENRTGFEVGQLKKSSTSSEFIDLRMSINAQKQANGGNGKVNNIGRADDLAQVNQNTVFTFPMTKGMKLAINTSGSVASSTLGGVRPTKTGSQAEFTSATKKGNGSETIGGNEIADVQLYINDAGLYMQYIEATYYPRLKAPAFSTTSAPGATATVGVTAPATSGAVNEKIYYTVSKDGSMPADPTSSSAVISGGSITETFSGNMPIIIKAINVADNRPDSKITTYVVLPYDDTKNTAVYFFNSEDEEYDMGADPVFRNLVKESNGKFNVIPYNIRAGVPADGDIKNHITGDNVKAYIAADKDKDNTVITGINTASKPVVSLHNVLDGIATWNTDGTEFTLADASKANLAIFDKVLIAYNGAANDKVCVSNTGSLVHSSVNYNAAYIIGNATKALLSSEVPGTSAAALWAATTDQPQVRKLMFAGEYISAADLGLLSGGETTYPVSVWSDDIQVTGVVEAGTGYIDFVQSSAGSMKSVVKLYSDEGKTQLLRDYTINLEMVTNTDYLIFTDRDNNTATNTWDNGSWSVKKNNGFVSGNDGDCFKFNSPTELTITGPANYGIKSVTFHGYDYVGGTAGGAAPSPMTATTVGGSMSSSTDPSTIKKFNVSEYQNHVDGDLKLNYPMTSNNTTTIRLENAGQWIGTIRVEYFERKTSSIGITKVDMGEVSKVPYVLPHNGHVAITFNSVMAEVTTTQAEKVIIRGGNLTEDMALPAEGNLSTLTFYYWNLEAGDYELVVPFAAFKDIYGTAYTGTVSGEWDGYNTNDDNFIIPFKVEDKTYIRKPFDFIVNDRDHNINWDGTHIVGLNELGDNTSDERKYMLFLNSEQSYHIEGGSQANKDNLTSTKFTDVDNMMDGKIVYNGRTRLTAKNLSLIGESQRNETNPKGVMITSLPVKESSSSTPTIEFKTKACTDNYIQDLTICNTWPYNAANFAGRATAFYDLGTNTILKNVRLESWQDTYYTGGTCGYAEDCTFMGVVDFIYGSGDYWYRNCDIILRDRNGNNIVAATTSPAEKWGYVFEDCTIDREAGASLVANGSYTIGRPWGGSPASTFLNTTFKVMPSNVGWAQMTDGLVVRYHEYGSKDESGNLLTLSPRSISGLSPAKGSDSPVLTEAEAKKYDIHTVLGGDTGFDPTEHTRQIPTIESLYVDGQSLYWKDDRDALCYFVYYLGDGAEPNTDDPILVANIAPEYSKESGFNLFTNNHVFRSENTFEQWYLSQSSNDEFTHGWFAIRAANQRGGLNKMSNIVEYHKVREYKARVTIGGKETGDNTGNVWSTIYLDFNAKAPQGVYAYALTDVTAFGGKDVTETTVYFKRVSDEVSVDHQDIVYKNMGYLLYGPGPEHSTHTNEYHFIETGHMNIVDGNEESRDEFTRSYLSGTIGNFKGTVSNVTGVVGETGERGWSSYYLDYTDVPVGYTSAYTLSTKTVEGTSYGLGFYKYQGSTFGHHKAYLDTDDVSRLLTAHNVDAATINGALSKGFNIVFSDVNDVVTRIVHVNGSETNDVSDAIYNTLGQRVTPATMQKGQVYIINGKKIRY